jgi:TM2 domain-containing membrane protein YozV
MGPPYFSKRSQCLRTAKSQKTALLLSFFFGVFAADRFYLGYVVSAVFKLLTVGGFGLVYVIDLILILLGWLGPSDNAVFPERMGIYEFPM